MALNDAMKNRLVGIRCSYLTLTERLGDPGVISNSNILCQVMKDRSQSKEIVVAFDKYCRLNEELEGAVELFQEAGSSRLGEAARGRLPKKERLLRRRAIA